jgi:hypothetical protein
MNYQTIEEYLTQFPDDVEEINVKFISDHLPDLSRFYKLKKLCCYYNQLTCLPPLSSNLKMLNCFNNQLKYLPLLPSTLKDLFCHDNLFLDYYVKQDKLSMDEYLTKLRKQIKITNQFRELFYSLKYKKQFQILLWFHIREPKIRNKYHPNNLIKMLQGKEEITMDELDVLIENW